MILRCSNVHAEGMLDRGSHAPPADVRLTVEAETKQPLHHFVRTMASVSKSAHVHAVAVERAPHPTLRRFDRTAAARKLRCAHTRDAAA